MTELENLRIRLQYRKKKGRYLGLKSQAINVWILFAINPGIFVEVLNGPLVALNASRNYMIVVWISNYFEDERFR
jgi:hypothetical protein